MKQMTTINIEEKILIKIKKIAIDNKITVSKMIEEWIKNVK